MRSLSHLRRKLVQLSGVFGSHVCKKNQDCLSSSKNAPFSITMLARNNIKPTTLIYTNWDENTLKVQPLNVYNPLYFNMNVSLKLPNGNTPVSPVLPERDVIGDVIIDGDIIGYKPMLENIVGYVPTENPDLSCSNLLKKRKKKMNKHKYKKRRKRDKFKRRNLENIKERKKRAREKADERAKQALA